MEVNFLAVLVAAVVAFLIGAVWYTALFGKAWQKETGVSMEPGKSAPVPKVLLATFVLEFLMAANLAMFIGQDQGWEFGLSAGLAVGIGWVALASGVEYLNEKRSFRLWLINAAHQAVAFGAMGVIIAVMQ